MIEQLRPGASAANARVALFDFDGTISVIRSGWMEIMIPMMVEILLDLKTGEREEDLRAIVEEFVGRLTGKQTMYQMIALAEEIENIKEVGGVAVGVATAEPECLAVDEWKRTRLAAVGADYIIPNFLCHDELLRTLFS